MVYFAALVGAWLYFRRVAPKEREKASPVVLSGSKWFAFIIHVLLLFWAFLLNSLCPFLSVNAYWRVNTIHVK
jgi:hypothetical protein